MSTEGCTGILCMHVALEKVAYSSVTLCTCAGEVINVHEASLNRGL